MKKLFVYSAMMALCSPIIFAAQQTWTGQISDAMCESDHAMMQKGTRKSEKECTLACIKSGQKYILMSAGKTYQIANQNFAGLAANAGGSVKVTGEASTDGNSITITKLEPAAKK